MKLHANNNFILFLFEKPFRQAQLDYFFRGILLVVFVQLIYYSVNYSFFFSNSIFAPKPISGYGLETFLNLFSHPFFLQKEFIGLMVGFVSLAGILLGYLRTFFTFLLWLTICNIHNRLYFSLTGGDILINQLLFWLIFVSETKKQKKYKLIITNFAFLALVIQISFVYFFSAWYKWLDPAWVKGEALGYIGQLPAYSNSVGQFLLSFPIVYYPLTWLVLIFQTLFPLIVFIKPFKRHFIWLGIIIHVGIALTMDLYFFSGTMIVSYLLFTEVDGN